MRLVLDAGAVSALAGDRERLAALLRRGHWPPSLPSVVLTEVLTGDHRRDYAANRLLRMCQVVSVDAPLARSAAALRTATGRAGKVSAVDAIVAAHAADVPETVVLTSDPKDLTALAEHSREPITIVRI